MLDYFIYLFLTKSDFDNITMTNEIHLIEGEVTRSQESLLSKKENYQYFLGTLLNNKPLNYILYEQMTLSTHYRNLAIV